MNHLRNPWWIARKVLFGGEGDSHFLYARLQSALPQRFSVAHYEVTGCATYGGHGEQMAVFKGSIAVAGPEWVWFSIWDTGNERGFGSHSQIKLLGLRVPGYSQFTSTERPISCAPLTVASTPVARPREPFQSV